jgi:hypothetical protein
MHSDNEIRAALEAAATHLEKLPYASKRLRLVGQSIRTYLKGDAPTLDHAFGLKRGRGKHARPLDPEHLAIVKRAFIAKMNGKPFKTIAELAGYEVKEFQRLWKRYLPVAIEEIVSEHMRPETWLPD